MKLLWLCLIIVGISIFGMFAPTVLAQTPTDPNTDRFLQGTLTPAPLPADSTPKPTVTPSPSTPSPEDSPSVAVTQARTIDTTVLAEADWKSITQPLAGKTATICELKTIADRLTQLYLDRGEINSKVILVTPTDGVVNFKAIEGSNVNKLEEQLRL